MRWWLVGWMLLGCSSSGASADDPATNLVTDSGAVVDSTTSGETGGFGADAAPAEGGGPSCVPPDMLIALDRTGTMSRTADGSNPVDAPDYKSAKLSIAIRAIEALVVAPLDTTVRFGLELWPRRTAGCITLAQKVAGATPSNTSCDTGEILVSPALSSGAKIAASLDPATTPICTSTPTGQGLIEGAAHLATIAEKGRDQYLLLVTDGADWDKTCPTPDPLQVTQANAKKGIKTFVLGFSSDGTLTAGGVGVPFLNDMACAGLTAPDFAKSCRDTGGGAYVAVDRTGGPRLFFQAGDAASLDAAMKAVTRQVCCDCPK